MPTIIRVNFRRDGRDNQGHLVRSFAENLDLDDLTPRARALAEALHDTMQHPVTGGSALDVRFESYLTNVQRADIPPRVPDAYRPVKDPDQRAQQTIQWGPLLSAASGRTVEAWLEDEARQAPEGWYPIGAPNRPRVPSWEAGAEDRYLTRDQAMERLASLGAGISPTGWDTLIRTPLLQPDRYAGRQPQWLPATITAFASRERELWPLTRVAEYLNLTPGSARVQMRRWGFMAESRGPGRGGENQYSADLVQAAHEHRPGQGKRPGPVGPPL